MWYHFYAFMTCLAIISRIRFLIMKPGIDHSCTCYWCLITALHMWCSALLHLLLVLTLFCLWPNKHVDLRQSILSTLYFLLIVSYWNQYMMQKSKNIYIFKQRTCNWPLLTLVALNKHAADVSLYSHWQLQDLAQFNV